MSHSMSSTALRSVFRVSPVFALLWEQWRVTRGPVLLALALMTGSAAVLKAVGRYGGIEKYEAPILSFTFTLTLLFLTVLTLVRRSPDEGLGLGFPKRETSLPMSRTTCVWTILAYRLGLIGALALVLGGLLNVLYGQESPPSCYVSLLWICFLSFLMAISWTFGGRGPAIALLVLAVLLAPVLLLLSEFGREILPRSALQHPEYLMALYIAMCSGIAAWGAQRDPWKWPLGNLSSRALTARRVPARLRRLGDPANAVFWYEWRKRGLVLPICMVCALLLGIGHEPALEDLARLALLASGMAGFAFLWLDWRDFHSNRRGMNTARPVSSRILTMARLRMGFYSVIVTYAATGALIACATVCFGAFKPEYQLGALFADGHALILLLLFAAGYLALAWLLLWLPLALLAAGGWLLLVTVTTMIAAQLPGYGNSGTVIKTIGFGVLAIATVLAVAYFGSRSRQRGLFPKSALRKTALFTVVAWLLLLALPIGLGDPSWRIGPFDLPVYLFSCTAVVSLPALAVFSQAVWVDRLRFHV